MFSTSPRHPSRGIGRVCPCPLREEAPQKLVDDAPVSIREIKRFVGDWALKNDYLGAIPETEDNGVTVAVVGGGPPEFPAAYYPRLKGYRLVIFEKEALLGGMMRYGIPDYRLSQAVLQKEIDWLLAHGVEVRTGMTLKATSPSTNSAGISTALSLAMGCRSPHPCGVPGEDLNGVLGGINFLYDVKTNPDVKIGRRVAVVGGGNTAMDAACPGPLPRRRGSVGALPRSRRRCPPTISRSRRPQGRRELHLTRGLHGNQSRERQGGTVVW